MEKIHNIKSTILTILEYTIQWHCVHKVVQLLPLSISRTFLSSQTETLYLLNNNFLFPPPLIPWLLLFCFFCLSGFEVSHVSGIIHYLSFCVWLISCSINVFKFHPCSMYQNFLSFLKLNNIPLYIYTIFCLFIHLLMDIWVLFPFGYCG